MALLLLLLLLLRATYFNNSDEMNIVDIMDGEAKEFSRKNQKEWNPFFFGTTRLLEDGNQIQR